MVGRRWKGREKDTNSKVSFYDFLTIFRRIKNIPFQKASVSLFTCMKPYPTARRSRWWWRWWCNGWEALKRKRKGYELKSEFLRFFYDFSTNKNIPFQKASLSLFTCMKPYPTARRSRWWWRWWCNGWEALKRKRKWYERKKVRRWWMWMHCNAMATVVSVQTMGPTLHLAPIAEC